MQKNKGKKAHSFQDRRNVLLTYCFVPQIMLILVIHCCVREQTSFIIKEKCAMCVHESFRLSVKENVKVYMAFNRLLRNYPQEEMTAQLQLRKRDTAFKCHYQY